MQQVLGNAPFSDPVKAPDAVAVVRAVLGAPDEELDYARAKLTFDRIIDPSQVSDGALMQLARLTESARDLAGADASDVDKLNAVRTVIYAAGPWNDDRPFAYDQSDPLGRLLRNKLLANYLETRLGQCVSMPVLFLILADRLGLNVALATAPEHVFLRYTDSSGRAFNLETTSGAQPARDDWLRQSFPMTDRAIRNGLYLRTLSRRESVVVMAMAILEYLRAEQRFHEVIELSELLRGHNPRDAVLMIIQGSAYGALLEALDSRHPIPFLISEPLRLYRLSLIERNNSLITVAEVLGWQPLE